MRSSFFFLVARDKTAGIGQTSDRA